MASFDHIFIVSYLFRADLYIIYPIFCISASQNYLAKCDVAVLNSWVLGSVLGSTCLLTPWSRALLEKLTDSTASQEIPHIFGTRKFITVFTSAHHLSLSWVNSIQSPQPSPTSWRSILILSSHLRLGLPNYLFPSGFPTRTVWGSTYGKNKLISVLISGCLPACNNWRNSGFSQNMVFGSPT
jgi:hypothetical protein